MIRGILLRAPVVKNNAKRLEWKKLLSDWRNPYFGNEAGPPDDIIGRSHFESDYDRVVFSQPFRRLARKTQVHPMALNDHVHNRLTHSIEVASVGRSFGRKIANLLIKKGEISNGQENDLVWILMASCASHDIGNPPFGHAGEAAIREWAASHIDEVFASFQDEKLKQDVLKFEGNAQGFRIASRSDNDLAGHLRLTYATLGAMVKYPWCSDDRRAEEHKKCNYFSSEKKIFENVFSELGLKLENGNFVRHPLSFLSEAADDICYRVLDLEDAADLRIVTRSCVRGIFNAILGKPSQDLQQPLAQLRSSVIKKLIDGCWKVFENGYGDIMTGKRSTPLIKDLEEPIQNALKEIDKIYTQIFSQQYKVITELGAYKSIGRILKAMCLAIQDLKKKSDWDQLPFVSKRCFDLAWGKNYVEKHKDKEYGWWLHQVLDYVAGMTDNSAMKISRGIEGT